MCTMYVYSSHCTCKDSMHNTLEMRVNSLHPWFPRQEHNLQHVSRAPLPDFHWVTAEMGHMNIWKMDMK